jgi:putative phosphoesterase
MPDSAAHLIGLISDTHGLLRLGVHQALHGVEMILHAGDVGGTDILDELRVIAPTKAVYGNTDEPADPSLTQRIDIEVDGLKIHVSHGHEVGSPTPDKLAGQYDADVVVYGHTHQQLVTRLDNRLFVNPGSAGPRRFSLLPSVARLMITNGKAEVQIIDLA